MKNLLAHGCTTFSKRADQHVYNWPKYFNDLTISEYTDWVCGLGSNLIGWQNNYSGTHEAELQLAERLLRLIPMAERVKFVKTGSAACEAAIRIARAATGRKDVVGNGYHGCSNAFIAAEDPGLGCVNEGYTKTNDILSLIDENTAAVIIEPVQLDMSEDRRDELKKIRTVCTKKGVYLIFDEIITGFRVPYCFISNYWRIKPDLICGGKALGNGYPLAFVAGREKDMNLPYFISNTHNGELSAISEALKTLNTWESKFNGVWITGEQFNKRINSIVSRAGFNLVGYPTRGEWRGDQENFAKFCELMAEGGHLVGKAWFLNFNITSKDIESFMTIAEAAISAIKAGYELKGYVPQPVFRRN